MTFLNCLDSVVGKCQGELEMSYFGGIRNVLLQKVWQNPFLEILLGRNFQPQSPWGNCGWAGTGNSHTSESLAESLFGDSARAK